MNKLNIAITALTTLMLSATVMADDKFIKDAQDVASRLNINEEKQQLLKDVMSKHHEERKNSHKQEKEARYEKHKAMQVMREKHRSEIKGLLTASEFEMFEKIMFVKRKQRHGGIGKNRNQGPYKNKQPM